MLRSYYSDNFYWCYAHWYESSRSNSDVMCEQNLHLRRNRA